MILQSEYTGLNLAQEPIFSGLMFFNEPEHLQTRDQPLSPSSPEKICAQKFHVLKNFSLFELANLVLEVSTLRNTTETDYVA